MTAGTPEGPQVDANTVIELLRQQVNNLTWDNTLKAAQIAELQFQGQRVQNLEMKNRELELRLEATTTKEDIPT